MVSLQKQRDETQASLVGFIKDGKDMNNAPMRYVSADRVYSPTSLCIDGTNTEFKSRGLATGETPSKPSVVNVYTRRHCRPRDAGSFFSGEKAAETIHSTVKPEPLEIDVSEDDDWNSTKRKIGSVKLAGSASESYNPGPLSNKRMRKCRFPHLCKARSENHRCTNDLMMDSKGASSLSTTKRWVRLNVHGVDPTAFIGLQCRVYWPLDAVWYSGYINDYTTESNRHHIEYEDGDIEDLIISKENIKFFLSAKEMEQLGLSINSQGYHDDRCDYAELVALAASLDDGQEFEPGDIVWAKLTGHAMWPALVVDKTLLDKELHKFYGGEFIVVQFFGTHDFARVEQRKAISFLKGLLSCFHSKCKKPHFARSLEEAKVYLNEQKLPERMQQELTGMRASYCKVSSSRNRSTNSSAEYKSETRRLDAIQDSPYVFGDLQILSVGRVVEDSQHFQDNGLLLPEGYTALRKFISATDPKSYALYKLEVLRDPKLKSFPLFRVTLETGEQITGSNPSECWDLIFERLKKVHGECSFKINPKFGLDGVHASGSEMFGFSKVEVQQLIKKASCKLKSRQCRDILTGYRPVHVEWKDLDKCNVCYTDEEYENNLFLQCDKCRIMVHSRCYGELDPPDGVLWLCNLCRPGAPDSSPICCLCPITGGAMKPTTDGRWAHLTCAIWIPETCFSDIRRMEPIDGLDRISKDRWKLLCSICGVAYGACIQCSNSICRVAYHPLCARAAGLYIELEDEDNVNPICVNEDDDIQVQQIRLHSFCKKHKQPANKCHVAAEWSHFDNHHYIPAPPCNTSGCVRTEPYNHLRRRGRKEPEALSAASLKQLFVENQPYLIGGYCQHKELLGNMQPLDGAINYESYSSIPTIKSQVDETYGVLSLYDKYRYMRQTAKRRLAFGKSGIHGFGVFAKYPHRAGDMVIEYTGELVRPCIADRRERIIYNSLVGAGTYMFRIDDERVIDATRAGSIAHLINHSCEPNCYSRVISINGDAHIMIFAKRDIKRWEELTYDYRFFSIEKLPCYCGFPRCRGVVNETETEHQMYAPRGELMDCSRY